MVDDVFKQGAEHPGCIRSYSGLWVNVFDPKPEMFCIEDIAHALSNICRWAGHVPKFYSVAEHSLNVSNLLIERFQLQGLMHDASEAYLGDFAKPIKDMMPQYKKVEHDVMTVIAKKFGFKHPYPIIIHDADMEMLRREWVAKNNPGCSFMHNPLTPETAKELFLSTFKSLTQ